MKAPDDSVMFGDSLQHMSRSYAPAVVFTIRRQRWDSDSTQRRRGKGRGLGGRSVVGRKDISADFSFSCFSCYIAGVGPGGRFLFLDVVFHTRRGGMMRRCWWRGCGGAARGARSLAVRSSVQWLQT